MSGASKLAPRADDPHWLAVLRAEAAANTIQDAADRIGRSRTAVSLALDGKYPSDTAHLEARVLATLCDRVPCAHLRTSLPRAECAERSTRPMPQSSAADLRAWHACQGCPNKPKEGGSPC